jgi:hypothetical protein
VEVIFLSCLAGSIAGGFVARDGGHGAWAVIVVAMAIHYSLATESRRRPTTLLLMAVVIGTVVGLFGHYDLVLGLGKTR